MVFLGADRDDGADPGGVAVPAGDGATQAGRGGQSVTDVRVAAETRPAFLSGAVHLRRHLGGRRDLPGPRRLTRGRRVRAAQPRRRRARRGRADAERRARVLPGAGRTAPAQHLDRLVRAGARPAGRAGRHRGHLDGAVLPGQRGNRVGLRRGVLRCAARGDGPRAGRHSGGDALGGADRELSGVQRAGDRRRVGGHARGPAQRHDRVRHRRHPRHLRLDGDRAGPQPADPRAGGPYLGSRGHAPGLSQRPVAAPARRCRHGR